MKKRGLISLLFAMCAALISGCGVEEYEIKVSVNSNEYGYVTGAGKYKVGKGVVLEAHPNDGCSIMAIEKDNVSLSDYNIASNKYVITSINKNDAGNYKFIFVCEKVENDKNTHKVTFNYSIDDGVVAYIEEYVKGYFEIEVEHGKNIGVVDFIKNYPGIKIDKWYTNENYTNEYDFSSPITGDKPLYVEVTEANKEILTIKELIEKLQTNEGSLLFCKGGNYEDCTTESYDVVINNPNDHFDDNGSGNWDVRVKDKTNGAVNEGYIAVLYEGVYYQKVAGSDKYTRFEIGDGDNKFDVNEISGINKYVSLLNVVNDTETLECSVYNDDDLCVESTYEVDENNKIVVDEYSKIKMIKKDGEDYYLVYDSTLIGNPINSTVANDKFFIKLELLDESGNKVEIRDQENKVININDFDHIASISSYGITVTSIVEDKLREFDLLETYTYKLYKNKGCTDVYEDTEINKHITLYVELTSKNI